MKQTKEYFEKLTEIAIGIDNTSGFQGGVVLDVANVVLKDEKFSLWSGSSQPIQHHYGEGGLVRHTLEVVELCFQVKNYYEGVYEIDATELFLSALFHDAGKMYDYKPHVRDDVASRYDYNHWRSSEHKRMIHHISRSGIIWSKACDKQKSQEFLNKYHDKVLHAILAHHMQRQAGSPVAPKSRVAWILTLCDNLSARVDDADRWDILEYRNKK